MNKEDAVNLTYKVERKYKENPTMLSWERVMKAMDLYADSKVKNIVSNTDVMRSLADSELRKKMLELLYNGGVDAIVNYIKGNDA
jgi:hypothetical protein